MEPFNKAYSIFLFFTFLCFSLGGCGMINGSCQPDHTVTYSGTLINQTSSPITLYVCIANYQTQPFQFALNANESSNHVWASVRKKDTSTTYGTDPVTGACPTAPDDNVLRPIYLMKDDAQNYKICSNLTGSYVLLKSDNCPQNTTEQTTTCD